MTQETTTRVRRYSIQGLLALGAIGLGVWGVYLTTSPSNLLESTARAQAGEPQVELDESTYYAVGRLRNELSLTQKDLRALGCSESTASSCLSATLSWYQSNKVALHTARNNVLAAKKALYKANRADPRPSENEYAQLGVDLKEAREALQAVQDQAVQAIGTSLSVEQRDRWAAGRNNRSLTGALRYVPDLTDDQKARVRSAQADSENDLAEVISLGELTYTQQQAAAVVHAAMNASTNAVTLAENAVLPVPESIQADRDALANSVLSE